MNITKPNSHYNETFSIARLQGLLNFHKAKLLFKIVVIHISATYNTPEKKSESHL